jgi:hypothetical protein
MALTALDQEAGKPPLVATGAEPYPPAGQVTFLCLFIMNVVGMGLGPRIVAGIGQYVFGEAGIRYGLALT